jgi:hypothetical protein
MKNLLRCADTRLLPALWLFKNPRLGDNTESDSNVIPSEIEGLSNAKDVTQVAQVLRSSTPLRFAQNDSCMSPQ